MLRIYKKSCFCQTVHEKSEIHRKDSENWLNLIFLAKSTSFYSILTS